MMSYERKHAFAFATEWTCRLAVYRRRSPLLITSYLKMPTHRHCKLANACLWPVGANREGNILIG
jgi:hypothetical protein